MIKIKSKPLTLLIILVLYSFGLSAQSLNINYTDGSCSSYNIEDVRKITFDADVMNLHINDGSVYSWNVSTISQYQYNDSSLNVKELLANVNLWEANIYPNPTNNEIHLCFNLIKEDDITIALFDIKGKQLINIQMGKQSAGEKIEVLDLSGFPSGIFFCHIIAQNNVITKKIIKY